MGGEILKDEEGKEHCVFDQTEVYDDNKMGDKIQDFEIIRIQNNETKIVRSIINQKIYSMIRLSSKDIKKLRSFENDIKRYINLNYFHILKFHKYFSSDNEINIIAEHTNNGTLSQFINLHSYRKEFLGENKIWNLFLQMSKALRYLHSQGIIHGNLNPNHFWMTNEKIIKLELSPIEDTLDIYHPPSPESKGTEKADIYSLGCIFYQITYVIKYLQEDKFAKLENESKIYSPELLDLIKIMLNKDASKRPTAEELFIKIRDEYDKRLNKNSSITSLISCLCCVGDFSKFFLDKKNNNIDKNKTPISFVFSDCINSINNNEKWDESIKNFRRYLTTKNPKLESEQEIPFFSLFLFLVENLHKELNKKPEENTDIYRGYLIKRKEDKTNKADMLINFLQYYKEHFNSIISDGFFGIIRNNNICVECGLKTYSFNGFCFLHFDIDKYVIKDVEKLNLMYFFDQYAEGKFHSNSKNIYHCIGCSKCTVHELNKSIYSLPKLLVICFTSKSNNSNIKIDYPDEANFENEKEYELSPGVFTLKGFINKVRDNDKEKYVSYFRSNDNIFYSCDKFIKKENNWNKTEGNVVMIFYEAIK